jgi:hypothetical protein
MYSDIAYIRSKDSGLSWSGAAGGWSGHLWDNLTKSSANSQMPSIACISDQYTSAGRPEDLSYNSDDVHVSYNEDAGSNSINVFYLRSPNNGQTWYQKVNVTANTGGSNCDAYSSITVDQLDHPHLVFMRGNMLQREPLRTSSGNNFLPGINPSQWRSFPGPEAGMYGVRINQLAYAYFNGTTWSSNIWGSSFRDYEFPTVSLDRRQNLNVICQMYMTDIGDYEITRDININLTPPAYPLVLQTYRGWRGLGVDNNDWSYDDLFPNLATKKAAMYYSPDETNLAGYDDIFIQIGGHGPGPAIAPSFKDVYQDGNVKYDWGL